VEHLAVGISHTRFAPCADEPEEGAIVYAPPQHVPQPLMVYMVTGAFDVRFNHRALRAKWQVTREIPHRISCSSLFPVAVAPCKNVLLVDGFQSPRYRHLEECILCGGDAQRAQGAVALRDGVPADHLRPVALVFDALHEGGDMVMQPFPIGSDTDAVSPRRRSLLEERPAAEHLGNGQHAKEMAQSVRLVVCSFLRSSLQGGWHCVLQSFMPGPCFLCRLPHAVSPFRRTSTCLSQRTLSCSDSLKVFSRPSCGRRGFPAPCWAQDPPGSPTFSTLLSMHATP